MLLLLLLLPYGMALQYVDAIIEQRAERGLGEADVSEFFWFGSPRLITRLFTLVYFGNSLSLANTIFGLTGVSLRQNAFLLVGHSKGQHNMAGWHVASMPMLHVIAPTALAACRLLLAKRACTMCCCCCPGRARR